jgi:hypothetical protein
MLDHFSLLTLGGDSLSKITHLKSAVLFLQLRFLSIYTYLIWVQRYKAIGSMTWSGSAPWLTTQFGVEGQGDSLPS